MFFRERGLTGLPNNYDHEKVGEEIEGEEILDDFYGNYKRDITPQAVALKEIAKFNKDQKEAFGKIAKSVQNKDMHCRGRCFFVNGSGGCGIISSRKNIIFIIILGKTFLYNALIRWCFAGMPDPDVSPSIDEKV